MGDLGGLFKKNPFSPFQYLTSKCGTKLPVLRAVTLLTIIYVTASVVITDPFGSVFGIWIRIRNMDPHPQM